MHPKQETSAITVKVTKLFRRGFLVASMLARGNIRCLNVSRNAQFYTFNRWSLRLLACILPVSVIAAPLLDHSSALARPATRSRVLIVQDERATVAFKPDREVVGELV